MKTKVKDILPGAIFLCMALLTVFAPFFTLIGVDPTYTKYIDPMRENGYDLITMESPYFYTGNGDEFVRFMVCAMGVLSLLLCLYGIVMAAIGLAGFFVKGLRATWKGLAIASLVLLCVYSFGGITYYMLYLDFGHNIYSEVVISSAYVPALLGFILFFFFHVVRYFFPEGKKSAAGKQV